MKKAVCILFIVGCLGKNLSAQTLYTIDSLAKVEQACLDEGRCMTCCVISFERQMDSLIQLSLKKLYAKGDKKSNPALQKDQENWLAKQKAYNKKAVGINHEEAVKGDYEGGEIERINLLGKETDFVKQRAIYLIKKLNKP